MMGTPPPGPYRCGSTTCSTKPAATAASNAFPPFSSTAIPAAEASQWVDATMPNVPASCGRVVKLEPCGIMRTPRAGPARWVSHATSAHSGPPAPGAPPAVTNGRPDRLAPRPAHDREQAEMRALAVPHRTAVAALVGAAALLAACTSASQTTGGATPATPPAAAAAPPPPPPPPPPAPPPTASTTTAAPGPA